MRERVGVRVAKDKTLILITLILGSGILLRSTSSIHGVVAFSLEGRRDSTFYDTLEDGERISRKLPMMESANYRLGLPTKPGSPLASGELARYRA